MTIAPPRRAVQGAATPAQLLSNVQIHDCAFLPACKSRSFCTYKTASHLHIPQLLKVPQFQDFASKPSLTRLVCADTQSGGEGAPDRTLQVHRERPPSRPPRSRTSSESTLSKNSACNPRRIRSCETKDLKYLRMTSLRKTPGAGYPEAMVRTGRIPDTLDRGHS